MRFSNVAIAALAHVEADEVVGSEAIERRLEPLYARLGLSVGRLELMTGIRERRFFARGVRPSQAAARAAELALARTSIERERIGRLIHASVCRDFLEPATASVVHRALRLPPTCTGFDLSNACLGFANAITVLASEIELGALAAGLIVAAEDGRALVEATIDQLVGDPRVGKRELKLAFASLTIGSGAAAMVLARGELAPDAPRLVGAAQLAATEHIALCHGDRDDARGGPLMETDSEALLVAGNELGKRTFERFTAELGWPRASIERVITHQVGVAHRRTLLATLELDPAIDYPTVERLGNMGSVSLPTTLSAAVEAGFVRPGHRVALLGIGSGLQCQMLGVQW